MVGALTVTVGAAITVTLSAVDVAVPPKLVVAFTVYTWLPAKTPVRLKVPVMFDPLVLSVPTKVVPSKYSNLVMLPLEVLACACSANDAGACIVAPSAGPVRGKGGCEAASKRWRGGRAVESIMA